uniref:Ovule protein n=1 Tax=Mesocestoides corti TaxID=53468 RepID=A0A5K3FG94_MESCO
MSNENMVPNELENPHLNLLPGFQKLSMIGSDCKFVHFDRSMCYSLLNVFTA